MIVKNSQGYQVKSESGRALSASDLTKEQAEKRLQQVEMFKHMHQKLKKRRLKSSLLKG